MREQAGDITDIAEADLVTRRGTFRAVAFRDPPDGHEHLALVLGDPAGPEPGRDPGRENGRDAGRENGREPGRENARDAGGEHGRQHGRDAGREGREHAGHPDGVLVRVHSECLTGDVFGATRCECGEQLNVALDAIAAAGRGVLIYLRGHEGRGIGLVAKVRTHILQDEQGLDTIDSATALGLPVDVRDYRPAARLLRHLGVARVRLMTNNPGKVQALRDLGVDVAARVPLLAAVHDGNLGYLTAKRDRLGHDLPHLGPLARRRAGGACG